MKTNIQNLKTNGLVAVPYPAELRRAVEITAKAWKKFCALPLETKKGLPYSNSGAGVGYELKDGVGVKADRKENFDVTTAGKDWVRTYAQAIENSTALDFVQLATDLVGLLKPIILDFARECEKEFNLPGFVDEVAQSEDAFFVRFIHYFGDTEVGNEIATAHADQSGFTLHLFESDPGLQCLTYDGTWIDMPVSAHETVIIPDMQMQLRSKGELKALCHRVIATPETAQRGRFSAVLFVQFKHTPKWDKATQGRLQEREPGFNYSMSHGDFSKLFVE